MSDPARPRSARGALYGAIACGLLGMACIYIASATSMLRMTECPSFSFNAPNPDCRTAMYWSTASVIAFAATIAFMVLGLVRRRR